MWASHDKLLFWEGSAKSFVYKAASHGGQLWVWLQQMVLSMDDLGSRARYQMQTGSVLVRVWEYECVFQAYLPMHRDAVWVFQAAAPGSGFSCKALFSNLAFQRPCWLTWPSWTQLVYLGPAEYL